MSSTTDQAIAALRAVRDRLAGKAEKMGTEELAAQSGASEWTVAQVFSHLGSGAEIMLGSVDAALAGADKPADTVAPAVWERWNAMAPADQAAGYIASSGEILARLEGLDEATRKDLRVDLGFLPKPADVLTIASMGLSEATLHGWDVDVAFDREAALAPEGLEFVFETSKMFLPYFAKPDAVQLTGGRPLTVAVELTDPRKSFGLSLAAKVTLLDGAPSEVAAVFKGPTEAWLRLTSGRLTAPYMPDSVSLYGGGVTLDQLRAVFPGY